MMFRHWFAVAAVAAILLAGGIIIDGMIEAENGSRNWYYFFWYLYTHERHERNVRLTASVDMTECNHEYPIHLDIANESGRPLRQIRFLLFARRPPDNRNLATIGFIYEYDHILEPGSTDSLCWRVPVMDEKIDRQQLEKLDWSIAYKKLRFVGEPRLQASVMDTPSSYPFRP